MEDITYYLYTRSYSIINYFNLVFLLVALDMTVATKTHYVSQSKLSQNSYSANWIMGLQKHCLCMYRSVFQFNFVH